MNKIKGFVVEEDGIGTVEMILILVVLIGIVLVFKDHLNSLVESIFKTINSQAGRV
ncbi:holin, BlyA family protein [Pseudobutyrivibrio xylanivorans]|uniref:Holin, BlyA family protein n=2 Tax=Pseudobutyrivibrio xylanivorans TaxID=185007 RepID=A0A5P6VVP1_PSEXY|nr:holin, BlyA family protein [Pseudobutyrivibrio xylanivorans]